MEYIDVEYALKVILANNEAHVLITHVPHCHVPHCVILNRGVEHELNPIWGQYKTGELWELWELQLTKKIH